jgi:hypothetical protein
MKKKILSRMSGVASLLLAAMVYLSSCTPEMPAMSVIPKDAIAVVDINVASLAKKVKKADIEDLKSYRMIKKELRSESKELARLFDELTENPASTGLNLHSDLFIFVISDGDNDINACFSAQLNNKKKFEDFITDLFDGINDDFTIRTKDNISIAYLDDKPILAWDKQKALCMTGTRWSDEDETERTLKKMMTLDSNQSILSNRSFKDFYRNKKDVNMWLSFDVIDDLAGYMFRYMYGGLPYDISDSYLHSFLSFEKNKIVLSGKYVPNEKIEKMLKKYDLEGKFNNNVLQYLPKESMALMGGSTKVENYYRMMMDEYSELSDIIEELEKEIDIELKELVNTFKGTFAASLHGFISKEVEYMGWGYLFNENDVTEHTVKPINSYDLSDLSFSDIEKLNNGETVKVDKYYYDEISLNIKKAIEKGYNFEQAMKT